MQKLLINFSIRHPKLVMWLSGVITLLFLMAFPSLTTDTDPVHMLPQNNPAITMYNQMKAEFKIHDMVVVGLEKTDGSTFFTVEGLTRIHQITKEILEIEEPEPSSSVAMDILSMLQFFKDPPFVETPGKGLIVTEDVIALSEADDIVLNEKGELKVSPLMKVPPKTEAEAQAILDAIERNPLLKGKIASTDGRVVGVYLPLEKGKKDRSYFLGEEIKRIVEKHMGSGEKYHLAGLPIAETTFGFEMFVQMGVYAPLAGAVIFGLMFFFFRNVKMILGPMMLAMMTVIWSMGALIYSGNAIHIMSSMIPIFLMPIAILDSVHIVSHLHDTRAKFSKKEDAIRFVIKELFNPMLFTTLTTMVGFVSLSTAGIPPVVVFGLTVGFGVFLAWLLSMTFMPAYCMLLDDKTLEKFGTAPQSKEQAIIRVVGAFRILSSRFSKPITLISVAIVLLSAYGIQQIIVNDNPVRWFKSDHSIRQADRVMNSQLAGTYMANLIFELPIPAQYETFVAEAEEDVFADDAEEVLLPEIKNGEVIQFMEKVQNFLLNLEDEQGMPMVGGITSLIDILQKVGQTALNDPTVPDNREAVAQYMFLFESGDLNRGKDMWKFVTQDGRKAQLWLQMKNGDNHQMNMLMENLSQFLAEPGNQPPSFVLPDGEEITLNLTWSGLTHINSVWQEEMVSGMRTSLLGSFAIVFLMMVLLFRSIFWGLISMLPLSLTILFIYGLIGLGGKFYDMPIAVLSSLTLGLSVDFAIHFIQSFREILRKTSRLEDALHKIFEEPSRAIWRNVLVIAFGFTPLFFATLVPYVTVGSFFFAIMVSSGASTLLLLPSIIRLARRFVPRVDLVDQK